MKALIFDESGLVSRRLHPALQEEGYLVDSASTRGEARWLTRQADVVVVCAARPGGSDSLAIETMRGDGDAAPVLVLAKQADSGDTVRALDAGADDVVVSPVSFTEVAARLRALQRRGSVVSGDVLSVGTLRLDRATRSAVRQDGDKTYNVELTRRELALLEFLMRHPGHVISRTRLLEHVWGLDADVSSNIVDQVVSRLRAKLDRPFGCTDIETIHGIGYRFGQRREAEKVSDVRGVAHPQPPR